MKIIALKINDPEEGQIQIQNRKRYSNILKGLSKDKTYYFYKNYELTTDSRLVRSVVDAVPPFIDHYYDPLRMLKNNDLSVNVCAIVGRNGSGKSSVIELLIRLINNFACSIIGDEIIFDTAHPLHFIPDIFAEFYYEREGIFYKVVQTGNTIFLYKTGNETPIYSNTHNGTDWEPRNDTITFSDTYLNEFFYTVVVNYSHYCYNIYDFGPEWNEPELMEKKLNVTDEQQQERQDRGEPVIRDVDRCWLTGIFHKNDGYQTPLVLNPYRYDGNIDIRNETALEKDRFLSVILAGNGNREDDISELLDNKKVHSLDIILRKEHTGINEIYRSENLKPFYETLFRRGIPFVEVYDGIIYQWSALYGIDFKENFNNTPSDIHEASLNYLVYKTLRIISKYNSYAFFYSDLLNKVRDRPFLLRDLVKALEADKSHITLKIRQTILFLLCGHISTGEEQDINDLGSRIDHELSERLSTRIPRLQQLSRETLHLTAADGGACVTFHAQPIDLLPPPFFKVEINLTSDADKEAGGFSFNTLSSGEKQMIFTVGSILYHLRNVDSVQKRTGEDTDDVYYGHINIILEEVELYYHPDLQRRLIKYLLDSIHKLNLSTRSIQIMVVTHSPFILSDIPSNNVLYMEKGEVCTNFVNESFGANIFELLKDNFFLQDGPIGEHAYKILEDLFIQIRRRKLNKTQWKAVEDMIEYVGEPFLKEELNKLLLIRSKQ